MQCRMLMAVALSALALLTVVAPEEVTRPDYIQCQTSEECEVGRCCVLGGNRYSIPSCRPLQETGHSCRPVHRPLNTTVYYPDGAEVELTAIYFLFCPCGPGLVCDKKHSTCQSVQ